MEKHQGSQDCRRLSVREWNTITIKCTDFGKNWQANFKIYIERQKAKNSKNYTEEEKTFLNITNMKPYIKTIIIQTEHLNYRKIDQNGE